MSLFKINIVFSDNTPSPATEVTIWKEKNTAKAALAFAQEIAADLFPLSTGNVRYIITEEKPS